MKFRRLSILLLICCLLASGVKAQVVDYGQLNGVFSFEKDVESTTASKCSVLSISDEHSKLGSHSLKWIWKKDGAYLDINAPVPYLSVNPDPKETSVSSFVFWIYSPEKLDGQLRFSFLKDGEECCHFDYTLGFEGWRGAWVAFDRDMEGNPVPDMDQVRISVSEGLRKGSLYFDGIITASFQDVRYHTADWQARFINKDTDNFWLTLNKFWDNTLDIPQNDLITAEEVADLKIIRDRFVELVTDGVKPMDVSEIRKAYNSYGIRRNPDGTITGKPVWFIRYGETYINQGIPDAMPSFTAAGQTLRQLNDLMLRIAVSYISETDPAVKDEIAGIYLDLTRHLLDQGFAAGSGQGTLHHLGYSMRNFYTGPVIMKDVLREAGLDDDMQMAMEWFCGLGEVKTAPVQLGMDIDAFNTSLMGRFASVLMLEDTPYKQAYMKAVSRWVDNGFKHTEGTRPSFKRDGTVVHHRKCYPEYAVGGFKGSVNAIWMLARTSFAVSEESHTNQKNALLNMRFFSNLTNFPLAMSGRHPDGTRSLIPSQFALLADAGSPDGSQPVDSDLAGAYLRLAGTEGRWGQRFTASGISPEASPEGGRYYGYNCSLSYRQGDWLVTFAGHSRYLWAAETYKNENHYGRYLTHGSMQFMNAGGSFDSGYRLEGWDWCHIPGTTAAEIPMEMMKADVLNVDEFSGYEEMLLSDEWFAGGLTFGNEAAMYSMNLHEHDKYNGSLKALKSFFAFGDRIVCIGSDLENSLEDSELHTTLFQNSLTGQEQITVVNGTSHQEDQYEERLSGERTVLRDRLGNSYIVSDAEVVVSRGRQNSLHEETDAPTEGNFEKAYIRHGKECGPQIAECDDDYEYLVVVGADQALVQKYAEDLPYEVVKCDSEAHIVRDDATGITACAAFAEVCVDQLVRKITPSVLMYRIEDEDLQISVSNPDLALYTGEADEVYDAEGKRKERSVYGRKWVNNPAAETSVTIVLDGEWTLESEDVEVAYAEGNTILTVKTFESATEKIRLKRNQK